MIASGLPGKDMLDILMIEDEPNIAEAVRFILTRDGWAMTLHGDGEGGVEAIRLARPRLVILDLMLPNRSGAEILRDLRADPDTAFAMTPVLMLTARTSHSDEKVAIFAGADEYMRKPFDPDELVVTVNRLIARAKERRGPGDRPRKLLAV